MSPQPASPTRRHRSASPAEPCLKRSDAAGFAAAFAFDADFDAPGASRSREIVLERASAPEEVDGWPVDEAPAPRARARQVVLEAVPLNAPEDARDEVSDAGSWAEPDRRTVVVRGGADPAPRARLREVEPRRAPRSVAERAAHKGDRIALYAVLLGIMLVVIAAASSTAQAGGF